MTIELADRISVVTNDLGTVDGIAEGNFNQQSREAGASCPQFGVGDLLAYGRKASNLLLNF